MSLTITFIFDLGNGDCEVLKSKSQNFPGTGRGDPPTNSTRYCHIDIIIMVVQGPCLYPCVTWCTIGAKEKKRKKCVSQFLISLLNFANHI
jgi:hypothetical protein